MLQLVRWAERRLNPWADAAPSGERQSLKRTTINVENSEGLPLSDAVRFGNLLFVSGMVGMDAAGKVVAGGIAAETRQTFRNIAAALAAGGATFSDALKVNVILTRAEDFAAFNATYREFFPSGSAGPRLDGCGPDDRRQGRDRLWWPDAKISATRRSCSCGGRPPACCAAGR